VIDDGGNNIDLAKRVAALNFPMTWAILPYERFSKATASIADEHKIPYLLHMPMQAETDKDGGPVSHRLRHGQRKYPYNNIYGS